MYHSGRNLFTQVKSQRSRCWSRQFHRIGSSFTFDEVEDEQRHNDSSHTGVQRRSFHSTTQRDFAPFLPEIIIGIGIGFGWFFYRTSQGKPLTPDKAIESQNAYRKFQEDLARRNALAEEEGKALRVGNQQRTKQEENQYASN